jgi:hypothetical protein
MDSNLTQTRMPRQMNEQIPEDASFRDPISACKITVMPYPPVV